MIWLVIIPLAALEIYLVVGLVRKSIRDDEEREAHRRFGGTAPK
jgi:hypothetical protein